MELYCTDALATQGGAQSLEDPSSSIDGMIAKVLLARRQHRTADFSLSVPVDSFDVQGIQLWADT